MINLKNTTELVKAILERIPESRNSDSILYCYVLGMIGKEKGIDIEKMSITTFLLRMKDFGFPPHETVRRARQKVQHDCPELAASGNVETKRALNEEIYRKYARNGV